MRRTVMIDDKLLEDAKKAFGTEGVRETIEMALKEAVRKGKRERLLQSIGNMDLGLTPEDLEKMRDDSCRTGPSGQFHLDGDTAEETEERTAASAS